MRTNQRKQRLIALFGIIIIVYHYFQSIMITDDSNKTDKAINGDAKVAP